MTLTYGQTLRALHAQMPLVPPSVALTFLALLVLWDLWLVTSSLPHDHGHRASLSISSN